MAEKKSASTKSKSKKKVKQLSEQLVLNKFFLSLFGASDFAKDFDYLKNEKLEEYDEDNGQSKFILKILDYSDCKISEEKLKQYDKNIKRHTNAINLKREHKIKWKYFQYLSLLFVEIYLDLFFGEKEKFLTDINEFLVQFNLDEGTDLTIFSEDDLKKFALWNATGSGKTLIMHVNIYQYKHYINQYKKSKDLNRVILLTPNEGLSKQHLEEFEKSGIKADVFSETNRIFNYDNKNVSIIDLHKIRRKKGDKTVALDSFETNNFVLIDEGHIGITSSGNSDLSWNEIRTTMCEDGFSIEYSATFGQAVDSKGKDGSLEEYSKSILFDYSYKYFYRDGFGKDYRILNMSGVDNTDEEIKFRYLVGSLLGFYQQLKLYNSEDFSEFNIYEPLMIFVGSKVNAVRSIKNNDTSDIVDILLFFNKFIENRNNEAIEAVDIILKGKSGLYTKNKDLFLNKLSYVNSIYTDITIEELYLDIIKLVFNGISLSGKLRLENLKATSGEIAVKINDNEAFAVINVGDTDKLIKLCESKGLSTIDNNFEESLFNKIKARDSKVKVLIGSKKFTEGWDSWRVSSIGLMNIGKKEGSQIIQLFGRGIRLQGYQRSLKRTAALMGSKIKKAIPQNIRLLETLNIFGVNADYMQEFRDMLLKEDVPSNDEKVEVQIPVLPTINTEELKKLKVIRVKNNLEYKKNAKEILDDNVTNYFKSNKVKLDFYTKIDEFQSKGDRGIGTLVKENDKFTTSKLFIMDMEKIYFEMIAYKKERCFYNINVTKDSLRELLLDDSWYEIYIPKVDFKPSFSNKIRLEEIAIILLQKYMDKFFKKKKSEWERDKLEYVELSYEEFVKHNSYNIEVDATQEVVIDNITKLKEKLIEAKKSGNILEVDYAKYSNSLIKFIGFDRHIYNPLVGMDTKIKDIKITPVELNEGEATFVELLKAYVEKEKTGSLLGKEIYLIRNQVGNVGFFEEGNFYPDFIMWIIDGNKEYITFIDPKGMRNEGPDSSKVMLHKEIKKHEEMLNKNSNSNTTLNSFILSTTTIDELKMLFSKFDQSDYEKRNILFIDDEEMIKKLISKIINS